MTISRKDFFKKVCVSGACLCGFGSFAASADNSGYFITQNNPAADARKLHTIYLLKT